MVRLKNEWPPLKKMERINVILQPMAFNYILNGEKKRTSKVQLVTGTLIFTLVNMSLILLTIYIYNKSNFFALIEAKN
jgi:hypothetical protein